VRHQVRETVAISRPPSGACEACLLAFNLPRIFDDRLGQMAR
jgi:hypothetical protein